MSSSTWGRPTGAASPAGRGERHRGDSAAVLQAPYLWLPAGLPDSAYRQACDRLYRPPVEQQDGPQIGSSDVELRIARPLAAVDAVVAVVALPATFTSGVMVTGVPAGTVMSKRAPAALAHPKFVRPATEADLPGAQCGSHRTGSPGASPLRGAGQPEPVAADRRSRVTADPGARFYCHE